jgi:hypothetical protein
MKPATAPRIVTRVLLVVVVTALAFWAGGKVKAFNPPPPGKAALSLHNGELLRVNVSDVNPGPCAVQASFFDAAGMMIGDPPERRPMPGHSSFSDVFFQVGEVPFHHARVELRSLPRGCATSNLQIMDMETGKTLAIYAGTPAL